MYLGAPEHVTMSAFQGTIGRNRKPDRFFQSNPVSGVSTFDRYKWSKKFPEKSGLLNQVLKMGFTGVISPLITYSSLKSGEIGLYKSSYKWVSLWIFHPTFFGNPHVTPFTTIGSKRPAEVSRGETTPEVNDRSMFQSYPCFGGVSNWCLSRGYSREHIHPNHHTKIDSPKSFGRIPSYC